MNPFLSKSFSENPKSAIQNPKWLGLSVIIFVLVVTGAVAQAQQTGKIPRIGLLDKALFPVARSYGRHFGRRCVSLDGSRERISQSSTDLQRGKMTVYVSLRRISSVSRLMSSWFIDGLSVGGKERDHQYSHSDGERWRSRGCRFGYSLARPGGNVTGNAGLSNELITKRLEIVKDVVPKLARVALLRAGGNHHRAPTKRAQRRGCWH